jgi:hypothetical protein
LTTKEKSGKSVYYANCDATKDIGVSILSLDKYDQVEEVIGEKKETGYQGWLSPSYGVLRAAPVLVFKKRGRNSVSSSLLLTFLGQEDIDTKKIESAETIKNDCLRFLIERFGG